jgi:hypothetical protein
MHVDARLMFSMISCYAAPAATAKLFGVSTSGNVCAMSMCWDPCVQSGQSDAHRS